MNTMKSSSIALFSYYQYRSAYELDYSSHVIILTYELAYSLCVMILTCATLCLTIHMTYMIRSRAKIEVAVRRSFGFCPYSCLLIRRVRVSGEICVVSLYTGEVLGCTGTFEYDGPPVEG